MRTHRNLNVIGRLAREELEENAVAPGEVVAGEPVEAGVDSLEADIVDVNDALVEVQDDEASTDDAAEVVDELEVAAESLRVIAQNGGLDRNGAVILNLHIDSLQRRAGYPANHNALSAESFGSTNSRVGQTTLSAEGIKEQAADLWKKIVEMFKRALASIAALWNRIFDGATKMKARAEKLVKTAGEAKGEAGPTFEQQKLAEQLHINGAVDIKVAAAAIVKSANELKTMADFGLVEMTLMSKAIEGNDLSALKGAGAAARKHFSTKVTDPASVGMSAPGEGLELYRSGEAMPGNRAMVLIAPASDDAKPEVVGKISVKLGTFDASKKVADKVALKTLSPADAAAVAKQIGAAADAVLAYKSVQKKSEEAGKKMIDLAAKQAGAGEAGEGKLSSADARNLAKGSFALVVNSAPPLAGYVLNAGTAALQYVEQSTKQYGKAKAEAPAAAKAA